VRIAPPSSDLPAARLQTHWAANVPASVAAAVSRPAADYSHTALQWVEGRGWTSGPLDDHDARVGLDVHGHCFVAREGFVRESCPLEGRTIDQALSELADALARHGGPSAARPLELLDLTRPPHAVGTGSTFGSFSGPAFHEVRAWFSLAAAVLDGKRREHANASELRCWPHHFDIAALWTLDDEADPEHAKSVGIGMSPGDETFPQPYVYVLPWPAPDPAALHDLAVGSWHTEGFVAATLAAADIASAADASARCRAFLDEAVHAATVVVLGNGG
jgi:hypothetical protein